MTTSIIVGLLAVELWVKEVSPRVIVTAII